MPYIRFSERVGIVNVSRDLQIDTMSEELTNAIWNVLFNAHFNDKAANVLSDLARQYWISYLRQTVDTVPGYTQIGAMIKAQFFGGSWHQRYDIAEFLIGHVGRGANAGRLNQALEEELSPYRMVSGVLVSVTNPQEIAAIDAAISASPYSGVRTHLEVALNFLAQRDAPDFRNSIKESISAVESCVREVTGDAQGTLGSALGLLNDGAIHPAFKKALSALYGYTSDANGIRHALQSEANLTADDAKFFLVVCSAFSNYLASKVKPPTS